ncbi:winged helix DNA-binding domain-containing protein [Tessaracoccus antarcticus]|uniref:Winged helix DNA-binding domain-containing protein n=1 Tax=Tessaracoccus antarcticus TaxID=2479848 RepID=A0A3M0GEV4_9ACTN|nr:winged helix DNA-binding domain-containing protein [Tessaracoccus antarcticus]RMB61192.1 winged helix DNA-binding domain-containing protein [Tessaracoccus antarcticus]
MPDPQLARTRLVAQSLTTRPHDNPHAAVAALLAMQGQDLPGVIASAALRTRSGDVDDVLAELCAGRLVRGYPMRGTVFLMAAADVLWVSELCAAPALRAAANRRHHLGLDQAKVDRARELAVEVLSVEPNGLPRSEFLARWEADGQPTAGGVGYHLLAHLIGEGTLCHGAWNGTDQNIAWTRTWVPEGSDLAGTFNGDRTAGIAELLRRYLVGHGPATIRDFAWWTKLPLRDIRAALPEATMDLEDDGADEPSYWRAGLLDEVAAVGKDASRPLLLPGFDEFILGYQDRTFAMTAEQEVLLVPGRNGVFRRSVVVDGAVKGFWRRAGRPGSRTLEVEAFTPIPAATQAGLERLFGSFPVVTD